ncbi:MAG: hypothetical protein VYA34_01915 [Myxococcota bacterium]|nr:hypothetical protein [Myxococcota bacterium]
MRFFISSLGAELKPELLEAWRSRFWPILWGLGVCFILFIESVSSVSMGQDERVFMDLTLALLGFLGMGLSGIMVLQKIYGDRFGGAMHVNETLPMGALTYVLARYLALVVVVGLTLLGIFLAASLIFYIYEGGVPSSQFFTAGLFLFLEVILLTALALFAAICLRPIIGVSLYTTVAIAGNFSPDILVLATSLGKKGQFMAEIILTAVYWVMPDLSLLSLRAHASSGLPISGALFFGGMTYAILYASVLIVLATLHIRYRLNR